MQLGEFFLLITTKGVDAFNAATGAAQKGMQGLEASGRKAGSGVAGGAQMAASAMAALGKSAQATAAQINVAFNAALPAAMKFSQSMAAGFGEAGDKAAASVNRIGEAAKMVGSGLSSAFTGAIGIIGGFATAGLAASVQGERLTWQMSLLARQVGSLFIPVIEACITVVRKVTEALQSLTGAQQKALGATIALAVGVKLLMSASGLGLIVGVISAAVAAYTLLSDAMSTTNGKVGQSASLLSVLGETLREIWNVVKMIGSAFEGMGSVIKNVFNYLGERIKVVLLEIRNLAKALQSAMTTAGIFVTGKSAGIISNKPWEDGKDRQELTPKGSGFENITSAFNRIQQSIANTFSPEKAAMEQAARDREQIAATNAVRDAILAKPAGAGV